MDKLAKPVRKAVRKAVTLVLLLLAPALIAAETPPGQKQGAEVYGAQLMTAEERAEYRERLRTAPNDSERARIMAEHRLNMQTRAEGLGVELPEHTARAQLETKPKTKQRVRQYEPNVRKEARKKARKKGQRS